MTTIGIVEDDRLLNEALARMLEKKGYHPLRGLYFGRGDEAYPAEAGTDHSGY